MNNSQSAAASDSTPDPRGVPGTAPVQTLPAGMALLPAAHSEQAAEVVTPEAAALLLEVHRALEPQRRKLMQQRAKRQADWDAGAAPDYPPRNTEAAAGDWQVAPVPQDLQCRRVEITGPCSSAKMVINMLSRAADGVRADTAMLDMEDALKPSWDNILASLRNIRAVAEGHLAHVEPATASKPERVYRLDTSDMALPIIRPRGLHLLESNLLIDGEPVSAALFDLVLSFFHAAPALVQAGRTPAYYIPKAEDAQEARWWDEAFTLLEAGMGLAHGTLKATFLIETLPAAFQMEEILWESREHAVGLNVGRWDKIFSDIKSLRTHEDRVLADRAAITMQQPWMANYAKRCVAVCHRRGAFAMGGMAAFTPGRTPEIRAGQVAKVLADKQLEASIGHDGCWVSHPYFIAVAMQAFPQINQLSVQYDPDERYPDILPQGGGPYTRQGLRTNVRVGIGYMEGWLRDIGCVAWDDLMEDLATLEISRAQTWQWLHHGVQLDDGSVVTTELVRSIFREELEHIVEDECADFAAQRGTPRQDVVQSFTRAAHEAEAVFTRADLTEFLYLASDPAA